MKDTKSSRCFNTWNNKQEGEGMIFSKIDKVMCNEEWLEQYEYVVATFLPKGDFDHCPKVMTTYAMSLGGRKSF